MFFVVRYSMHRAASLKARATGCFDRLRAPGRPNGTFPARIAGLSPSATAWPRFSRVLGHQAALMRRPSNSLRRVRGGFDLRDWNS